MKEEYIEQHVVNRRIALQSAARIYADNIKNTETNDDVTNQVIATAKKFEQFIKG